MTTGFDLRILTAGDVAVMRNLLGVSPQRLTTLPPTPPSSRMMLI